jgi:predicted acylesterase/phospholipase RssA
MGGGAVLEAERIAGGAATDLNRVEEVARELWAEGRPGPIEPMLINVSRRALYEDWERNRRPELAKLLREHEQFGYARRLLAHVCEEHGDSEALRQQHALCTYKDRELPAARRLERALEILAEATPITQSTDAETLGLAGAIYKRKWGLEARRSDLESALACYERGYAQEGHDSQDYCGINAAFVSDQLAALARAASGASDEARSRQAAADELRQQLVQRGPRASDQWAQATHAEALFGLGRFADARSHLEQARQKGSARWRQESTAMQLAELARLRGYSSEAVDAFEAFLGEGVSGALLRGRVGKVGVALSGGGFRASLFHIGVLARLTERGILRHVEVLSCVSGGSIIGAFYYLRLRTLLESTPDEAIRDVDYVELVSRLAHDFLDCVRQDLRGRLSESVTDDWRMLASRYSRTDRVARLLEEMFFSKVDRDPGAGLWRMTDLFITPKGRERGFSLRYENWLREAKVPILVLNATTLNTGHSWQFTASWMGEPPSASRERLDGSRRLRRVYYRDAPGANRELALATAVAASACVPGLFPPVTLKGLYEGIDVELVDGGVHDNQGIASLLEQDCSVILVSDASGQLRDFERPGRRMFGVAKRSNAVLMGRVRGSQYSDLSERRRSGTLRGLMIVHLKKGLPAPPRDWSDCKEPYRIGDDVLAYVDDPDYGIDRCIQRVLAELRTDLDAFSDEEAFSLMATGYLMTGAELEKLTELVPELGDADPQLREDVTWPFAHMVERLTSGDAALLQALLPGGSRFFRQMRAFRLGLARRPKGRVRRALESAGAPGGARILGSVATRGVLSPIRSIVSAPLAVVGGVATKLYRRVTRRARRRR